MLRSLLFIVSISLAGCASDVSRMHSDLAQALPEQPIQTITFLDQVIIKLSTGYSRKIDKGSDWRFVGTIKEGNVFRPVDQVFTVEGAHVHEAYLTLQEKTLVGFYFPGENAFSQFEPQLNLPIKAKKRL
ncbi:MAG: hypothetical protein ACPF9K_13645 [Neptuniibacter sp.]